MINFKFHGDGAEGFTLVELMIALVMSTIIAAAVYGAYRVQNKSYYTQDQVVRMQQNIRAALTVMGGDIRMALYDPTKKAKPAILVATANSMEFQSDLDGNGKFTDGSGTAQANEDITYAVDANKNLTRDNHDGTGPQPIASNITSINFDYIDDQNTDLTSTASAAERKKIYAVRVTINAVAEHPNPKYPTFGHRQLFTTFYIRNRGL